MHDPNQAALVVMPFGDVQTLQRVCQWARDTGAFSDLARLELTRMVELLGAVLDLEAIDDASTKGQLR